MKGRRSGGEGVQRRERHREDANTGRPSQDIRKQYCKRKSFPARHPGIREGDPKEICKSIKHMAGCNWSQQHDMLQEQYVTFFPSSLHLLCFCLIFNLFLFLVVSFASHLPICLFVRLSVSLSMYVCMCLCALSIHVFPIPPLTNHPTNECRFVFFCPFQPTASSHPSLH